MVNRIVPTAIPQWRNPARASVLMSAQLRYQGESTVTEAFQQANVALDQIVARRAFGRLPAGEFVLAVGVALNNPI